MKLTSQDRGRLRPGEPIADHKDSHLFYITERSQREVAKILGVSPQYVQQVEREAFRKLRIKLKEFYYEYCKG